MSAIISAETIKRADELWEAGQASLLAADYDAVLAFLENAEKEAVASGETAAPSLRAALKWRLARANKDCSKDENAGISKAERKNFIMKGLQAAKDAATIAPGEFKGHLWTGIMLGRASDLMGIRDKVNGAFGIKASFAKAMELNPEDAESIHCLGQWHFALADMNWFGRKASAAIGLKGTYAEALELFLRAEKVQAVYITNLFMIAKCYAATSKFDQADAYLDKVIAETPTNPDDKATHAEAVALKTKIAPKISKK